MGSVDEEEETEEDRAFHLCLIGGGRPAAQPSRGRRRSKGASASGGAGSRAARKKPTSAPTCPSPSISEPPTPPGTPAPPRQPEAPVECVRPSTPPDGFMVDELPAGEALTSLLVYFEENPVFFGLEEVSKKKMRL